MSARDRIIAKLRTALSESRDPLVNAPGVMPPVAD